MNVNLELSYRNCAYLRKSRADRDAELLGNEDTLARHRRILTELSEKLKLPISKFYCEVVSGDTITDRPVMQQLLLDVESGKWDGVYVVEVERLARGNTRDQGVVADAFKYSNTKIITPTKIYDPTNEFDEEYFEFGLFMSRREYKTINRRLQRGRIASVKEGRYICSTAPYGYTRVPIPHEKGYTLEINPSEADVVKMIYNWYCYGDSSDSSSGRLGATSIARRLDALSVKPRINDFWSKASIMDILKNITYTGAVSFGRYKEVKTTSNGIVHKTKKLSNDYTIAAGLHPAIISPDLFELAQKIRTENRKNTVPSGSVLQNPLSGIIYCRKCGSLLTRLAPNTRNKYSTLKCPNRYCNNVSSPLFLVEEQILSFLRSWLSSYEVNKDFSDVESFSDEISEKNGLLENINSEIISRKRQLEKAYDFLEKEIYTLDVFTQRRSALNNDIDRLEESKRHLFSDISKLESLREEKEKFAPRVRNLLDTYDTNTAAINNQILKEVISKIYYDKDEPNRRGNLYNSNFTLSIYPSVPF